MAGTYPFLGCRARHNVTRRMGIKKLASDAYFGAAGAPVFGSKGIKQRIFGSGGFKGRYITPGPMGGISKAASDVRKIAGEVLKIKDQLNTEKKYVQTILEAATPVAAVLDSENITRIEPPILVAQVAGLTATTYTYGLMCKQITPKIDQGLRSEDRVGRSIKLTGLDAVLRIQVPRNFDAPNTYGVFPESSIRTYGNGAKLKVYVIRTKCDDITHTMVEQKFLQMNPITGVADFYSTRDPHFAQDFTVIASKTVRLQKMTAVDAIDSVFVPGDTYPAGVKYALQGRTDVRIRLKMNHKMIWRSDGVAAVAGEPQEKYFLLVVTDRGNKGFALSGASNLQVRELDGIESDTGVQVKGHFKWFFVDN